MTSFKFIHAADLHLGSPFRGLAVKDAGVAALFADAVRNAFSALVRRAIEAKVAFFVIAGDVYDGEWKDNSIGLFFNREVARLDRAGIPVFLLKGNHDAESVVTRSILLPELVGQFDTRKPTTFRIEALKVALHGQGFAERAAVENLALAYPPPVADWFNIGVLHTSLSGRPPHANYAPCSAEDLASRGYDYWALGHVHDFEIVAREPAIVFPGNLQGRNVREAGAKGAVMVSVEGGRIEAIERVLVDEARWAELTIDIGSAPDLNAVLRAVEASVAPVAEEAADRLVALRLHLTGTSHLRQQLIANRAAVTDEVQAACHRVHQDVWLEKLDLAIAAPAASSLGPMEDAAFDLDQMLRQLSLDPAMPEEAERLIGEIAAKLPAGLGAQTSPLGSDAVELLSEARDVLLARTMQSANGA